MLRPEEAWERFAARLPAPRAEVCGRGAALGRVLTRSPRATTDVPASDVSAMDGFAIAGSLPVDATLPVAATIAAGDAPGAPLPAGKATRIMTGAPIPAGTDRVVPVEHCESRGDAVLVKRDVAQGANIRRRGEIQTAGDALLRPGAILTPGALALLATHGHRDVEVAGRPRVSILVTGDEVVPADTDPGPGELRDSHTDFLLAACGSLGIAAQPLGIAPDRPQDLVPLVRRALEADLALVTGGVSMGAYDLVESALTECGCEIFCDAVAMQPGKPLVMAAHPGGVVLALPGNPASAMVGFWLFGRPALRRMMGFEDAFWHGALAGRLTAPLPAGRDRDRFMPAELRFLDGEILVAPVAPRGSHDLGAFGRGTGMLRVRAGSPPFAAGERCEVLPLIDWPSETA